MKIVLIRSKNEHITITALTADIICEALLHNINKEFHMKWEQDKATELNNALDFPIITSF